MYLKNLELLALFYELFYHTTVQHERFVISPNFSPKPYHKPTGQLCQSEWCCLHFLWLLHCKMFPASVARLSGRRVADEERTSRHIMRKSKTALKVSKSSGNEPLGTLLECCFRIQQGGSFYLYIVWFETKMQFWILNKSDFLLNYWPKSSVLLDIQ